MTAFAIISPVWPATLFRGLANSARLSCLLAVREHRCTVNEVVAATVLSQPNVSRRLACLRDCGLVCVERSGRSVSYQLAGVGVETLLQAAESLPGDVGPKVSACPTYGQEQ